MNADVIAASIARSAARDARRDATRPLHDPTATLCPNSPLCPGCWDDQIKFLNSQRGPQRRRTDQIGATR